MTNLIILLHNILFTAGTLAQHMYAFPIYPNILTPNQPIARIIRTRNQPVPAVLLNMRLDMTPGHNLMTPLRYQRTSHPDLVAHVDQQAGYTGRHLAGGRSARGTRELIRIGRAEGVDGRTEATLAEDMVAL